MVTTCVTGTVTGTVTCAIAVSVAVAVMVTAAGVTVEMLVTVEATQELDVPAHAGMSSSIGIQLVTVDRSTLAV